MAGAPKLLVGEYNGEELMGSAEINADLLDILPMTESFKVSYDGDERPTQGVYYRSATQTEANRVGQVDVTYVGDYPSTCVCTLYDTTDGSVLLKTITLTYTWSGDLLTNVARGIT